MGEDYVSHGSVGANAKELGDIDELLALTDQRRYEAKRARQRERVGLGAMETAT